MYWVSTQDTMDVLTTDGLTKEFSGFVAVDDVDLTVRQGELHGLIGPNGAGKTTTFNLITSELAPTSGTVYFKDEDITGTSPVEVTRRGIGRSFQILQFFPDLTVRKHFRLALRDATSTLRSVFENPSQYDDDIERLAARVQLGGKLDVIAKNLSHGEKRYLDIGLVLAMDPELLLLDEPAAGLNPSETDVLEGILTDLRGQYSTLLIEHDIELVRGLVDRLTILHRGEVLATGPPAEITANETVKEVYLGE
jgi:ABC-type branched-subunit amino acid transport system ATPase component